jgi:hypothetical protein
VNEAFNREWLTGKFAEIQRRLLQALRQLNDDQVNWSPDAHSHSISTLVRHIEGNIQERVIKGMLHENVVRNREDEFKPMRISRPELETIVQERLQLVIDTAAARGLSFYLHLSGKAVKSRKQGDSGLAFAI